jgi:hypothetical protein
MSITQRLEESIDRLGVKGKLEHRLKLRESAMKLERELEEVAQRIPLWDRVVFFSDTEDEALEKELEKKLEKEQAALDFLDNEIEMAFDKISTELPPFAFACSLQSRIQSMEAQYRNDPGLFSKKRDREALESYLEELADKVIALYVADFDEETLFKLLSEKSQCETIARDATDEPLQVHESLGFAPVSMRVLLPLCAQRLLETGFWETVEQHKELIESERALAFQYKELKEAMPVLDKLNIFSDSHAETQVDQLWEETRRLQKNRERCFEQSRNQLHRCLSVYPPLHFCQRLLESAAVTRLLDGEEETNLSESGEVIQHPIVKRRVFLFQSMNRLLSTFSESFGGIKLPDQLIDRSSSFDSKPEYLRSCFAKFDESELPALCTEALQHVCLQGHIERRLRDANQRISLVDRLVFWSDTFEESAEDQLQYRDQWNKDWTEMLWKRLFEKSKSIAQRQGPFQLRDRAIEAMTAVAAISTDSGISPFSKDCSIYGKDEALQALWRVQSVFEEQYNLSGNLAQLSSELINALQKGAAKLLEEDHYRSYEVLSPRDFIEELTRRLAETDFLKVHDQANSIYHELYGQDPGAEEDRSEISLWELMKGFSYSMKGEIDPANGGTKAKRDELTSLLKTLHELYKSAAVVYPAALHYYEFEAVIQRVREVTVECLIIKPEIAGKKPVALYQCELRNHKEALDASKVWAQALDKHLGQVPGYHQLLEQWELARRPF